MTLYEIDAAIKAAYESALDAETGEIIDETAYSAIDALEMERESKIENVALWIKDLKAEAAALKAEKQAFADRQASAERKAESLEKYLQSALYGEKFKTTKVSVSFRNSKAVELTDEAAAINWLEAYSAFDESALECIKTAKSIKKTELKSYMTELAAEGIEIEGAKVVNNQSVIIK